MDTPDPTRDHTRRNIALLAICHGLTGIGNTTMIVESALVGHMLATNKAFATVPLGVMHLAVMLTAFPASFLMQRFGRRFGFSLGAVGTSVGFGVTAVLRRASPDVKGSVIR